MAYGYDRYKVLKICAKRKSHGLGTFPIYAAIFGNDASKLKYILIDLERVLAAGYFR